MFVSKVGYLAADQPAVSGGATNKLPLQREGVHSTIHNRGRTTRPLK